jgi:hypothetical protein
MEHKRDTTLHVRVEPELHERLARLAAEEDRPLSSWVRRALREAAHPTNAKRRTDEVIEQWSLLHRMSPQVYKAAKRQCGGMSAARES